MQKSSAKIQRLFLGSESSLYQYGVATFFHFNWIREFAAMSILTILLLSRNLMSRIVLYVLSFGFFLVMTCQILAVLMSQDFISKLSLENLGHWTLLVNVRSLAGAGVFILGFAGYVLFLESVSKLSKKNFSLDVKVSACLTIVTAIFTGSTIYPETFRKDRNKLFEQRMTDSLGPIHAFSSLLLDERDEEKVSHIALTKQQLSLASKLGIEFFAVGNKEYPLVRNTIYKGERISQK